MLLLKDIVNNERSSQIININRNKDKLLLLFLSPLFVRIINLVSYQDYI